MSRDAADDLVLVVTTLPVDHDAGTLAKTLVEERLAACVHLIEPIASYYRWEGAVREDLERQVVIKTTKACVDALQARLKTLHPYEVPELIILHAAGAGEAYAAWLRAEVRPSGG
jgi:periplasmic divalent cation tolerance protein